MNPAPLTAATAAATATIDDCASASLALLRANLGPHGILAASRVAMTTSHCLPARRANAIT